MCCASARRGCCCLICRRTPPSGPPSSRSLRASGLAPFAGLVNACSRKVAIGGKSMLESLDSPAAGHAGLGFGLPGEAMPAAIAEAHQHEAPLDLTLGRDTPVPDGGTLVAKPGRCVTKQPAARMSRRFPGSPRAGYGCKTPPPRCLAMLLAPRPGERIADLCAAPGGKTGQLPASAGAIVTAVDARILSRLARLNDNLTQLAVAGGSDISRTSWNGRRPRCSTPCCWMRLARRPERSGGIIQACAASEAATRCDRVG